MSIKQVIVMRADLGMRKGKMVAQGAHAAMAWMSAKLHPHAANTSVVQREWLAGMFTKICVRVDSEHELFAVRDAALAAGLDVHLITDAGKTEFKGVPTNTCLAIGPDEAEKIDVVTGHLELL